MIAVVSGSLVAGAALGGYLFLEGVGAGWLATIRCFAGGTVVASLATEAFPTACKEECYGAGVAAAVGAVPAVALDQL